MSKALPGEHYCAGHQGNHSHYAPHNCTVCTQATEIERLRAELAEAQTVKESLIVALDLFGRHSPKGKPCPVCEAIDAAMAGGEHG